MKYDDSGSEGCWYGMLFAVLILCAIIMFLSMGCATTCPPCQPEIQTVEVKVPVYSCPEAPEVPPLLLPGFPVLQDAATESETKAWYAEMVSVVEQTRDLLLQRIDLLEEMLDRYRNPTP